MNAALLEEAKRLSVEERIELAEALWDSIAEDADADVLPIPESHRAELDRRLRRSLPANVPVLHGRHDQRDKKDASKPPHQSPSCSVTLFCLDR